MTYPNEPTRQYTRPPAQPGPVAYSAESGPNPAITPPPAPQPTYTETDADVHYHTVRPSTAAYPQVGDPYDSAPQHHDEPVPAPQEKKEPSFDAGVVPAKFWTNIAVVCLVTGITTLVIAAAANAISTQVTETGGLSYSAIDYVFYGLVGFVGPAILGLFWYIVHAGTDIGGNLYTFATVGVIGAGTILSLLTVRPWSTSITQALMLLIIGMSCMYFIDLVGVKTKRPDPRPAQPQRQAPPQYGY